MTSLSLALSFLGALGFAAFTLWLNRTHPQAIDPLTGELAAIRKDLGKLTERFDNSELQRGLKRSG